MDPPDSDALPCSGKLVFDTQQQAKAAVNVAEYQRGTKLKTYRCRHCRLWHLNLGTAKMP